MSKFKITFKHKRKDLHQAVYGSLSEDETFEAVDVLRKKLEDLFDELNEVSKMDGFNVSAALEMCVSRATTNEELILFIYEVASANTCPSHNLLSVLMNRNKES